jgi:hypothetical protein
MVGAGSRTPGKACIVHHSINDLFIMAEGIHGCRWEDNIETVLQEVGWGGLDWIEMAQDRDMWWALVYAVMNFQVPQNMGNFLYR